MKKFITLAAVALMSCTTNTSLDSIIAELPVLRVVQSQGYAPSEVLYDGFSDDVSTDVETVILGVIGEQEPLRFQDTVYQEGEMIIEDVRYYEYENTDYLVQLFVADADGYLQEVLLLREVKFKQG